MTWLACSRRVRGECGVMYVSGGTNQKMRNQQMYQEAHEIGSAKN